MKARDEAALAVPVTEGDDGFEDLYAQYKQHVWNVVYALLKYGCVDRPDHAQDVNQEIWLKVKTGLKTYDSNRGEYRHWLGGIAKHASLDHLRKCDTGTLPIEDAESAGLFGEAPVEEADRRTFDWIRFQEVWAKLADDERTLARLTYDEDLSGGEIAQSLGIKEGTVRQRQFRLRKRLQQLARRTN